MGKKQKQKKAAALKLNSNCKAGTAVEDDDNAQSPSSSSSSDIIEGSSVDTSSDTDDMPELEDVKDQGNDESLPKPSGGPTSELMNLGARQSRGEKKARRMMMKLDLKQIENVTRVTMRKNNNILLYIDRPDVYKCPHTDTVVCFGEVRVEDITSSLTKQAAERFSRAPVLNLHSLQNDNATVPMGSVQVVHGDDDGDGDFDTTGMDEKDIELVQMQAGCSRKKAVKALFFNDNDVVNAIMALTVGENTEEYLL